MGDSAIYEAVLGVMECLVTEYDIGDYVRERTGSILPMIAPTLGEHNEEILGGLLGLDAAERERLAAAGII